MMSLSCITARAQFSQDKPRCEYMLKVDAGYMPFMANVAQEGEYGYYINDLQHAAGVNVMNGLNISQDFFVGLGLGYDYFFKPGTLDNLMEGWHSGLAFVDMDYRPLKAEFAPMVAARLGANYLMSPSEYGNTLSPYGEVAVGINWHYRYKYRNMERNYLSLYLQVGYAYMQQASFLPIRLGWRF